jgi:hypothetical protein
VLGFQRRATFRINFSQHYLILASLQRASEALSITVLSDRVTGSLLSGVFVNISE